MALTIFTPTYNRARLLPRVFESIKSQSRLGASVEWLVIDDGSEDETKDVLAAFQRERPDLVRFVHVENGGKHRAINLAASMAHGEWIAMLDSDDTLADGALADIIACIKSKGPDPAIGMLRGIKAFPDVGWVPEFRRAESSGKYADWVSRQKKFDVAEVVRRSVLQQYQFPDNPDERFMAESWLWHSIDITHDTWFVSRTWMNCYYQADGLSATNLKNRASSPRNAMDVYSRMSDSPASFKYRARASVNWWRYRFHLQRQGGRHRCAHEPSWPFAVPGWVLYRRDLRILASSAQRAA